MTKDGHFGSFNSPTNSFLKLDWKASTSPIMHCKYANKNRGQIHFYMKHVGQQGQNAKKNFAFSPQASPNM